MEYYRTGRSFLDGRDWTAARNWFQAGLEHGDHRCAYGLTALAAMTGEPTAEGLGKLAEVLPEIQTMAERGDADAAFILGRCHETGCAMTRSVPEAITWYLRADSLGNVDAMFNLGCVYLSLGPEAEGLALTQFRRAAEHGSADAQRALEHHRKMFG